jgi:hypothetical protein
VLKEVTRSNTGDGTVFKRQAKPNVAANISVVDIYACESRWAIVRTAQVNHLLTFTPRPLANYLLGIFG